MSWIGDIRDTISEWYNGDSAAATTVRNVVNHYIAPAIDVARGANPISNAANSLPYHLNHDYHYVSESDGTGHFEPNSDSDTSVTEPPAAPPSNPGGVSHSGSSPSSASAYANAPIASQYGMSAATAYQEALSNTAHQREVADLRAAGLNPVLSAGAGNGAGGATVYAASGSSASSAASAGPYDDLGSLVGNIVTIISGKSSSGKAAAGIVSDLGRVFGDTR